MSTPETIKNELCPSCGQFTTRLLDYTGWCFQCSLPIILHLDSKGVVAPLVTCLSCGGPVGDSTHKKCRNCREAEWLEAHADEIDRFLAAGASVYKAKKLTRQYYRTSTELYCRNCGDAIHRPPRGEAFFCMKPECRTAHNKFRRLQYEKGLDRQTALAIVSVQ